MSATEAWIVLVLVSAVSVWTAEVVANRRLAIAIIMGVTATKGGIIASRFMGVSQAPLGIRVYMAGWIVLTATMIASVYWFST